jgi:perosamine synthetase
MKIPFHKTHLEDEEIEAVVEVLKSKWITMGAKSIEFEERFKEFVGSKEAIFLNSATSALHLALKAIGLKEDDEVILPTNTFIATAEVVTYFNAKPILCDIEEDTHNIDVSKIEPLITERTKAIIPVHFAGQPCDMDEIYQIAKKYNLKVIEDAAHALPSYYKGNIIGSLKETDITCFSFYATKTLSTGEGGMATTNNMEYARSIKVNRLHGIDRDAWDRYKSRGKWYYEVIDSGYKYNSTDINASLGLVQLKKQLNLRDRRREIANSYNRAFKGYPKIKPLKIKDDRESSWHLYVVKVPSRAEVVEKLNERGIGVSVHFIPIHKQPYYRDKFGYLDKDYPIANRVYEASISLPIYPDMVKEEIDFVIKNLIEVVESV